MLSATLAQSGSMEVFGWLKLAGVGVAAVLVLLLGIYVMAKRDVFAPTSENTDTAEQRIEDKELRERSSFEIPLRSRVKSLSAPAKMVLLSSTITLGLIGYMLVGYMQTGSPREGIYSVKTAVAGVGILGIAGGYWLRDWLESRIGVMYNVYENARGEPDVEKIEYLTHERWESGSEEVIQQLHPEKLLGLFRRRMLIGMHRKLRSSAKPLTDVVTHNIPSGDHAIEVDDDLIINNTVGEPIFNRSPDAVADVAYRSPNYLSYERAVQMRQSKKRMQIERDAWQTTSAAKDAELDRLSDAILNNEWEDKQDLMELLREYEKMQRSRTLQQVDARDSGISREGQSESVLERAEKNGAPEEGEH